MKYSFFIFITLLLTGACNPPPIQQQQHVPKPLPKYRFAFFDNFGDCSYNYSVDTARNTIEVVTDSVDIPLWERAVRDLIRDDSLAENATVPAFDFSRFYSFRYCLEKDSFTRCDSSAFKEYTHPLIIARTALAGERLDTNPRLCQSQFPAASLWRSLSGNERYHSIPCSKRKSVAALTGDTTGYLLADTLLDLNGDSLNERLLIFSDSVGHHYLLIAQQESSEWKCVQNIPIWLNYDYWFRFSLVALHGKRSRAILISALSENPWEFFAVAPGRSWENICLLVPIE